MIIGSFLFFTALVALVTYVITRKDERSSNDGYFLGGRKLTFPLIAGSLLLTNLSTEQMVGLNGDAFRDGLSVMVWEVVAVLALVAMALFFLPRFLRSGITTVPQFLLERYGKTNHTICNLVFLSAYALLLLPIILYTGAQGMIGILDVQNVLGLESSRMTLILIVWTVGLIGSVYALFGGLRSVAVSDTLNGAGLLVGGLMITMFGLRAIGGSVGEGWVVLTTEHTERMNSIGGPESSVPFFTIFTGVLLLNFFYWTTNQQIIQRTLGASSLAEGQKGVLLTGALKLLGPLYLVIPGMIAFVLFMGEDVRAVEAYGRLVNEVLPTSLAGFFAAVMMGAILSSFNSALNSTCTLFSLGVYKDLFHPDAPDTKVVMSGKIFGWIIAITAMLIAPQLAKFESIFGYLQKMNGIYFIPIFAAVLVGLLNRRLPPLAGNFALVAGIILIALGYFVPPFQGWAALINEYHFLGLVFLTLTVGMLIIGYLFPLPEPWVHRDSETVNLTPWKFAPLVGTVLVVAVIAIYALFADFSVLTS